MNRPTSQRDRLAVSGLHFLGYHGVYDDERAHGRRFRVDLEVALRPTDAADTDALADTVDYRDLAAHVMAVGEGPSRHLIESLADAMAERILGDPRVVSVELELRKYADGVPGDPEWVAVRIYRER